MGANSGFGASGAIIPKDYTAELIWDTTGDNQKGINIANGGKLTVYGAPDYYGGVLNAHFSQNWNGSDTTIYLSENVSGKWLNGQQLLVHKGTNYSNYSNDLPC